VQVLNRVCHVAREHDLERIKERRAAVGVLDVAGVKEEQTRVRTELGTQPDRFAATLTRARAGAWAGGFALFLLAYAVLEFRDAIGVPAWVAVGMSLFVAAVSFWLFVYGLGFRLDR